MHMCNTFIHASVSIMHLLHVTSKLIIAGSTQDHIVNPAIMGKSVFMCYY